MTTESPAKAPCSVCGTEDEFYAEDGTERRLCKHVCWPKLLHDVPENRAADRPDELDDQQRGLPA
jgi:hypothetical protein